MPQDNTTSTPINDSTNSAAAAASAATEQALQDSGLATSMPAPVSDSIPAPVPAPAPAPSQTPSPASDTTLPEPPVPASTATAPVRNAAEVHSEVINKIAESKNVLIALSSDPSVDEMSAAIGLSLYLDRLGKRATAIYSGTTPNALEFLKPEDTFESSADTLQDFVIAINKDKADHLRYKLDGEYVKVYITPYRTRVSESDLEFSYGDYNVDLVLALDVNNGIDLDSALREHGRIMHDAVIINITTGNPGKFGEIEWSDKSASSISEMIAALLYEVGQEQPINKDEATAFLTGIVAATNRFSNAKTTSATMQISSQLMDSGANQQLVAKNITPDVDNEMANSRLNSLAKSKSDSNLVDLTLDNSDDASKSEQLAESDMADDTHLEVTHEEPVATSEEPAASGESTTPEESVVNPDQSTEATPEPAQDDAKEPEPSEETPSENQGLLDDLKAAEESLAHAGAEAVPTIDHTTLEINGDTATVSPSTNNPNPSLDPMATGSIQPEPTLPKPVVSGVSSGEEGTIDKPEMVIAPIADPNAQPSFDDSDKYGKMLEDALNSISGPSEPTQPIMSTPDDVANPATANAPSVSTAPEINGVPEMNFMPAPDATILPPPPAPPIGASLEAAPAASPIEPAVPVPEPEPTSLGAQPAMQDQVYSPQANDPSAFKIPGM